MHLNNDKLKQALFLVVLCLLGIVLFWFLRGFISAFLGSVVFYILLRRPYFYLTEKPIRPWNKTLAILTLMLASFVVMILPFSMVTIMLSDKVGYLVNHYQDFLSLAQQWSNSLGQYLGVDLLTQETVTRFTGLAAEIIPQFVTATLSAVADIFILYFLLYFMLSSGRQMEKYVRDSLPFKPENDNLLLSELKNQTISNAIGIPVLATLQALTAWVGYLITGMDEPFFWAIITGVMSVFPIVGTAIVWAPLALVLYVKGGTWQPVFLFAYGALVITNIDNLFRFVVQKRLGDIHPVITFFGVIIGLNLFGFVGVIFGPLLISYFILLLRIYRSEYVKPEQPLIV